MKSKFLHDLMENKKNLLVHGLIIGLIILGLSFSFGIGIQRNLDNPDSCMMCHEMRPFVSSYNNPPNGSVISKHDMNCLECHNNNIKEARSTLVEEIKGNVLHKITGVQLDLDLSALSVNCKRCHSVDFISHFNVQNDSSCNECHWAHKPSLKISNLNKNSKNIMIIPYGPHENQTCSNCHGTAFEIPKCTKCHEGHYETKPENKLCIGCHVDPHVPIIPGIPGKNRTNIVKLPEDMPLYACQPCHETQFYELNNSFSLHAQMNTCNICHNFHGYKPVCIQCHNVMEIGKHLSEIRCNVCHGKGINDEPPCQACHGMSHEWSGFSATNNPSS